jgi:hypothetical protein
MLYFKFTLQMNPISVTAVEASFHEMRDKSYLCSVCGIGNEMSNFYRRPSIEQYNINVAFKLSEAHTTKI